MARYERLIRKQAMRNAATARKQKGNYGQHNRLQLPLFVEKETLPLDLSLDGVAGSDDSTHYRPGEHEVASQEEVTAKPRQRQQIVLPVSHGHLELCRISCSSGIMPESLFLLLKLVPLTGLRLGLVTRLSLRSAPWQIKDLISRPNPGTRKLLSFIPSRYQEFSLLRHAVDCLAAKLCQLLQPADYSNSEVTLRHYTRAVEALRAALDNEVECLTPETLCAAELLSAFEALNERSSSRSWLHHVTGAARLIEFRGPERFQTEFEISLFVANIGPTVMEAFLGNKACFLSEDRWQQVMRLAVLCDESFAHQGNLAFALWSYLLHGPKLFKETTDIVCAATITSPDVIEDLIQRLLECRIGLLQWLSASQQLAGIENQEPESHEKGFKSPHRILEDGLDPGNTLQLTLRGTFTMCLILKTRLLYSLAPTRFPDLEAECQMLAFEIISSGQFQSGTEDGKATWRSFMSQSAWIAKGILETKQSWSEECKDKHGVIDKWKFEAWCKVIGGKCP